MSKYRIKEVIEPESDPYFYVQKKWLFLWIAELKECTYATFPDYVPVLFTTTKNAAIDALNTFLGLPRRIVRYHQVDFCERD